MRVRRLTAEKRRGQLDRGCHHVDRAAPSATWIELTIDSDSDTPEASSQAYVRLVMGH